MIIGDIKAVPIPTDTCLVCFFNRVQKWLHSDIVCRVRLHQVDNIESISTVLPGIARFEIVPLREAACSIIIFEIQIILKFTTIQKLMLKTNLHFNCSFQVPTFKSRFKNKCFICWVIMIKFEEGFEFLEISI